MPVAVVTTFTYTRCMTDNIVPFDAELAADLSTESTTNVNDLSTSDPVELERKRTLDELEDRLAALARLIDGVGEMLSSWQTGEEPHTDDDVGVVSRMITSMEQALHLSVAEDDE